MKTILDYLKELSDEQKEHLFYTVMRQRHKVDLKFATVDKTFKGYLLRTSDKWRFQIYSPGIEKLNQTFSEVTIKLESPYGTYFFKPRILFIDDEMTVVGPFQVYQLTRRKNIRFAVPAQWPQSASFYAYDNRKLKSTGRILDFSVSGLRLVVDQQLPLYTKHQIVHLQFKIYRRAEITIKATVKHIKKVKQHKQELGLEFVESTTAIQNRIDGICSDLSHHLAQDLASPPPIRGYK